MNLIYYNTKLKILLRSISLYLLHKFNNMDFVTFLVLQKIKLSTRNGWVSKMHSILVILILLFLSNSVLAQENSPSVRADFSKNQNEQKSLIMEPGNHSYDLSLYIYYYKDISTILTIDDIRNLPMYKFKLNDTPDQLVLGLLNEPVWIKLNIDSSQLAGLLNNETEKQWFLHFDYSTMEHIDIYIPGEQGEYQLYQMGETGVDRMAEFVNPKPAVRLHLDGKRQVIFLKTYSPMRTTEIPIKLMTSDQLSLKTNKQAIFHGLYYGIMFIMFIYNFLIFLTVRQTSYLYYCLYVLLMCLTMFSSHGRLIYFLGDNYSFYLCIVFTAAALTPIFASLFTQNFLQTKKNSPTIHKLLYFYIIAFILFIPLVFLLNQLAFHLYYLLLFASTVTFLVVGFRLYHTYDYAKHYTHAWIIYVLLLIVYSLRGLDIFEPMQNYSLELGSMIEATLLSFALAFRIRHLQESQKQYDILQKDLSLAKEVQRYLLPKSITSGATQPKKENKNTSSRINIVGKVLPTLNISGDFYDYHEDNNKINIFMVDVAGHGYAAGLVASMIKVAFHETAKTAKSASMQQSLMNDIIMSNVQNTFAKASNLWIEHDKRRCTFVRSGHTPLIHFMREENKVTQYYPTGIPLGVKSNTKYQELKIDYKKGDRMLIFTDGLIEEENEQNEAFGLERLKSFLAANCNLPPETLIDSLILKLQAWKVSSNYSDDIAVVVIDLF